MKAILVDRFVGNYEELTVSGIPEPIAEDNQVIVSVRAAALNFVDLLYSRGKHQNNRSLVTPPFILGSEFAGVVSYAPKASKFRSGDRVFGGAQGAFAENVVVSESNLYKIPTSWTFQDAAGLAATAPVSYGALVSRACLKKGEYVLVHGGAGGLGLMAIQIAKAVGAIVIATAGSEQKRTIAKSYGADIVVDYNNDDWWKEVLHATKGGVNVVYDSVGLVSQSMKCCAPFARILLIGFAGTEGNIEKIAMNRVLLRQIQIIGYRHGDTSRMLPDYQFNIMTELVSMIESRSLRPTVYDKHYHGLDSIKVAMHDLAVRRVWGKAVITLNSRLQAKARM